MKKIHDTDCVIDFGIKGWNHNLIDFNNREHLMNYNLYNHFADFEESE